MRSPLPSLVAALALLLLPGRALAWAVTGGGRIERMDLVLAFSDDAEVLALSPVLDGAGAGLLVLPVPKGATLASAPPPEAFREGVAPGSAAPPAAAPARGAKEARPGVPRVDAPRQVPGAFRVRAEGPTREAQVASLGGAAPLAAGGAARILPGAGEPALASLRDLLGPAAAALPEGALRAYAEAGFTFLVVPLPSRTGRYRLDPVAVRFASRELVVPIRLAAGAAPETVSIDVLGPRPLTDLGGMDLALGLRRTAAATAPSGAEATWAREALDVDARSHAHLVIPTLNGPRHPLAGLRFDLLLPRPAGGAPPESHHAAASGKAEAETAATSPGCAGCGCGGPLFGLLLLGAAFVGPRRRP